MLLKLMALLVQHMQKRGMASRDCFDGLKGLFWWLQGVKERGTRVEVTYMRETCQWSTYMCIIIMIISFCEHLLNDVFSFVCFIFHLWYRTKAISPTKRGLQTKGARVVETKAWGRGRGARRSYFGKLDVCLFYFLKTPYLLRWP